MGLISDGSYGVEKGLVFSYPVRIRNGRWSIVPDLKIDDWSREMLDKTQKELIEEKNDALKATGSEWLDGRQQHKSKIWRTKRKTELFHDTVPSIHFVRFALISSRARLFLYAE